MTITTSESPSPTITNQLQTPRTRHLRPSPNIAQLLQNSLTCDQYIMPPRKLPFSGNKPSSDSKSVQIPLFPGMEKTPIIMLPARFALTVRFQLINNPLGAYAPVAGSTAWYVLEGLDRDSDDDAEDVMGKGAIRVRTFTNNLWVGEALQSSPWADHVAQREMIEEIVQAGGRIWAICHWEEVESEDEDGERLSFVSGSLTDFFVFGCIRFEKDNEYRFLNAVKFVDIPDYRELTRKPSSTDRLFLTLTSGEIEVAANLMTDKFHEMAKKNERILKNACRFYPASALDSESMYGVVHFGFIPTDLAPKTNISAPHAAQKVEFFVLSKEGNIIDGTVPKRRKLAGEKTATDDSSLKVGLMKEGFLGKKMVCGWVIPERERKFLLGKLKLEGVCIIGHVIEAHPSNNSVVSGLVSFVIRT